MVVRDQHAALMAVQQALHKLGYYFGEIDGHSGPLTQAAVTTFAHTYGVGISDWRRPEFALRLAEELARFECHAPR